MMRQLLRQCLFAAVLACVLPAAAQGQAGDAGRRPPNIVFIMADDLGPEWLGCYGAAEPLTPRIDALAAGGTRFTAVWASPICTPTRVMLLTGQYPFRTGWTLHHDAPRWGGQYFDWRHYTTWPQLIRRRGYATAIAGKWQINDLKAQPRALENHGFDEHCVWTGYEAGNPASGERYFDPFVQENLDRGIRAGTFGPDVYAEFLIDFMRRNRQRPFLAYYPMVLTHTPFTPTPRNRAAPPTNRLALHRGMVAYMDELVGRLVDQIERLELTEQTIVIFTSDNGTAGRIVGRAGGRDIRGGKGGVTERGVRVPLVVSWTGHVPAGVTSTLVDFTDLMPTLLELTGTAHPPDLHLDGRSLAPLLWGRPHQPREWVFTQGRQRNAERISPRVVRGRRYKLYDDGSLFDLAEDPLEQRNLAQSDVAAHVEAREALGAVLAKLPADSLPRYESPGD